MWHLFRCYVTQRHEYGVLCEPGAICLKCVHCGKRSPGWDLYGGSHAVKAPQKPSSTSRRQVATSLPLARVVPFPRSAAR
jgi:hypothetical protein